MFFSFYLLFIYVHKSTRNIYYYNACKLEFGCRLDIKCFGLSSAYFLFAKSIIGRYLKKITKKYEAATRFALCVKSSSRVLRAKNSINSVAVFYIIVGKLIGVVSLKIFLVNARLLFLYTKPVRYKVVQKNCR